MRKQDKAIIWPAYFDQTKTRKNGRRVPKNMAVPSPKIEEIHEAAGKLGLKNEVVATTGYPKTPWQKTGSILVEKKTPKEQILKKLAKQLVKARSELVQQK
ncbi:MAG TPA: signal recognition particle subunit SRP19/SEC65 family protein [Candidatus Bathyarchaeia archaeon]|nr:signal recognition particle subunit SRP19/SEC65 family protein [Candidatus Bathyarchaeia archaeon]